MKKSYIFAMMLPLGLSMAARQLSPAEAISRVEKEHSTYSHIRGIKNNQDPVLTVTAPTNKSIAGLYVFNNGDQGFMIVSADDCAVPLLGYSDTGSFDASNMPPQLRNWLDFYADQISWASSHGVKLSTEVTGASAKAAISPLTKSKWNQGEPYNDDCPLDNGKRSVTGCVATAMAQAMYYHQWPATGTGSHSYSWNGTTLSVDFGTTEYAWSDMTDTYDDDSSTTAKAAVANLMYSCGVSVDMNYTSDESGASATSMGTALYKYFGYDKSMASPQRSFYGDEAWGDMVYDQLAEGLPVLYGGQSYEGGHQFICDGYDGNGYYHFNWGWGGMSDGYFLLSALNPLDQGIGGSASDSGFNYDQSILINMKPAETGSKATPLIYCYGNLTTDTKSVTLGEFASIKSSDGFFNFACTDIEGYVGVKLVDSQGKAIYLKHDGKMGFGSISGYNGYDVELPTDLADGTYTVTPVFQPEGDTSWVDILCPLSGVRSLTMTVDDGTATITDNSSNQPEVTNFKLNTPIYIGDDFSVSFTMTNTGDTEYFGEYLLYLFDEDGTEVGPSADINTIDLLPGESQDITYVSKFPKSYTTDSGTVSVEPGTYMLGLFTHFTKEQIYIYDTPVSLETAPATTTVKVTSLSVDNGKDVVNTKDVEFEGTAECTEGYFTGKLTIAVFKEGSNSTNMTCKSQELFIPEGETENFTAHIDISSVLDTEEFFAIVYDGDKEVSDALYFSIAADGVVTIGNAEGITINIGNEEALIVSELPVSEAAVYNLDGIAVWESTGSNSTELSVPLENLSGESYILVVKDSAGHRAVKHFIKQ